MIHDAKCESLDDMMNDKCPNYDEKNLERGKWKEGENKLPQFVKWHEKWMIWWWYEEWDSDNDMFIDYKT